MRKAAWRLPALAGLAVLRFNSRGTSSVHGTRRRAVRSGRAGERFDVVAADRATRGVQLATGVVPLLGWSFGTDPALRYGCDPGVAGAILLSPPLRAATTRTTLKVWADSGKPVTALIPEFDDYLRPTRPANVSRR